MSAHRFSSNGKPDPSGTYVKNELDRRLDRLTELLAATEAKLLGMQMPQAVEYQYSVQPYLEYAKGGGQEHHEECMLIGVQRIKDGWRLCHGSHDMSTDSDRVQWKPLVECSVLVRVEAAQHIEGLKAKIVERGKDFIPKMDEAIQGLERFLTRE
jgi:hypothetical protein